MKTYILTLFSILTLTFNSVSAATSGKDVPAVISNAVAGKYQSAEIKDFRMENNMCLVRFTIKKEEYEAVFEKDGTWVRTGRYIKLQKLDKPIITAFKESRYADWNVESVTEVEFSGFGDVLMWEIRINDGSDSYSLFYNNEGQLVMKTYNMQLRIAKA